MEPSWRKWAEKGLPGLELEWRQLCGLCAVRRPGCETRRHQDHVTVAKY